MLQCMWPCSRTACLWALKYECSVLFTGHSLLLLLTVSSWETNTFFLGSRNTWVGGGLGWGTVLGGGVCDPSSIKIISIESL